jgi:hypothetical protein
VWVVALMATAPVGTESPASGADGTSQAEPARESAAPQPLEEFVPSEQISADRAVSFPVDI